MLHLKRASAGSGKTYALTKTYIRLLISYRNPGEPRKLRPAASLSAALPAIMAVTFTVKATDEMKSRIVDKLADLASAASKTDPDELKEIHYLKEFQEEFKTDKDTIAEAAKNALRVLLLHYSDFNVSTIDSFFQSILHTFAYEVNLEDTFNLEIDSDYVATMGLNAALDTIAAAHSGDSDLLYWIKELMTKKSTGNQWNVFQRRDNSSSLYTDLVKKSGELNKEKFKNIREELEGYFDNLSCEFRDIVSEFDNVNAELWEELHEKRKKAAEKFKRALDCLGLDISAAAGTSSKYIETSLQDFDLEKIRKIKSNDEFKRLFPVYSRFNPEKEGSCLKGETQKELKKRGISLSGSAVVDAMVSFGEWNEAAKEYSLAVPDIRLWKAYRGMLPILRIVMEISRLKKEYLDATNSLEISDTNSILKTIIGENDTPFIYERLGSRINHYLIDEFQDTSRMQWENFYPLLKESVDRGNDDLIIGDAKQSIYRFRNADYKLISEVVPEEFGKQIIFSAEDVVMDPARENTNFRSMANVVNFNNSLFRCITDSGRPWSELFDGIADIYSDCEQAVSSKNKENPLGYIELNFYPKLKDSETVEEESIDRLSLANPGLKYLPELILELKSRGYDYKDIGILVRKNTHGNAVVKVLADHNANHPDQTIDMISEESLLVRNSSAVRLIVHALELTAKGPSSKLPEKSSAISEPVDESQLYELLRSLQSMALPSVVEALISRFLPNLRESDIPYVAAFQDAVLDYCGIHTSDIGSFLKWWEKKADTLAISTPEDSDGVRIITVHKSKGLEYGCVIMPYLDYSFLPSSQKSEWRWVRPHHSLKGFSSLPPYIPVETGSMIEGTVHESIIDQYRQEVTLDTLNSIYVAFTRAKNELYVFGPLKSDKKSETSWAANLIEGIAADMTEAAVAAFTRLPEQGKTITLGRKLTSAEIASQKREEENNREKPEMAELKKYQSYFSNNLLQVKDSQVSVGMVSEEDEEADSEESDPRSDGHRKHRLMEMVEVEQDLDKAIKKMLVTGFISVKEADVWKAQFNEAFAAVRARGWFDPANRVINERTILQFGEKNKRPDRIIVRPDGGAVIIDYKFGEPNGAYKRQVRKYLEKLVESGMFEKVDAYLWYVTLGKIEKVE